MQAMNLSDTFYIALCMTILILGVVYWFWTQNQYMQRKINLLENMVFEMKTSLTSHGPPEESTTGGMIAPTEYPPAPSSVLGEDEDLLHEELHTEVSNSVSAAPESEPIPAFTDAPVDEPAGMLNESMPVHDDLQPGGVGSGLTADIPPDSSSNTSSLDMMTIKELRRMAEQRGISGAEKMRKPALIEALRATTSTSTFDVSEGTLILS
jgi:hypothetical protein